MVVCGGYKFWSVTGFIPKVNVNQDTILRIISGGGKLFLVEELTGGFGSSLSVLGITGNLPKEGFPNPSHFLCIRYTHASNDTCRVSLSRSVCLETMAFPLCPPPPGS